jgi:large subunit ribosomal protein L32
MGALPTKKVTRSRQGKRFAQYRLSTLHPARCPQCRSAKLSHRACPSCGFYKGRQVVGGEEK